MLFAIVYLGFVPRIALESSDSGQNRIDKIRELVRQSQYSVHDLSRLKAKRVGEFYRMNMPFELGLDRGCATFGPGRLKTKKSLILERRRYDFQKALSDLSGVDIKAHSNKPVEIIRVLRAWFIETVGVRSAASATRIWYDFNDFAGDFYQARKSEGYKAADLNFMPVVEYITFVSQWVDSK